MSVITSEDAQRPPSRRFVVAGSVAVVALLAGGVLVVHAALTFTSTGVTGDGTVNLTGVGTSTIDVGSSTLDLQTTRNGPLTFGNGVTTIPNASGTNETLSGYLTVSGSSTFTGTASFKSTNNNVQYADQFSGATADVKITACLAALPSNGGICDARGLTGNQSIAATITIPANDTLLLGAGIYTRASGAQILYSTNSSLIGMGSGGVNNYGAATTRIWGDDAVAAVAPTATGLSTGTYNVDIGNLEIASDVSSPPSGSIGLSLDNLHSSYVHNVDVAQEDVGVDFCSASHGCFYNKVSKLEIGGANTGLHLLGSANSNDFSDTHISGITGDLLEIDQGVNNDTFEMLDLESSGSASSTALDIAGGNIRITGLYAEAVTSPGKFESTASNDRIYGTMCSVLQDLATEPAAGNYQLYGCGSSINGNSGGLIGSGLWLKFNSGLDFDFSASAGNAFHALDLQYIPGTQIETVYGQTGYAPLDVGLLNATKGVTDQGQVKVSKVSDPTTPTLAVVGTAGTVSVSYAIVCHDSAGGSTNASGFATITNAPDTLDSSNYVKLSWPVSGYGTANTNNGCTSWTVLKDSTSSALIAPGHAGVTDVHPAVSGGDFTFNDIGQATSSYTAPTRNTTGDATIAGSLTEGCAGTATLSSGSATVSNSCITGSRPVICTDNTATSSAACSAVRSSGSITLYGSGADTVSWAQL